MMGRPAGSIPGFFQDYSDVRITNMFLTILYGKKLSLKLDSIMQLVIFATKTVYSLYDFSNKDVWLCIWLYNLIFFFINPRIE